MAKPSLSALSEFGVATVASLLLVLRQTHTASPLLPVDLLRILIFALSIAPRLPLSARRCWLLWQCLFISRAVSDIRRGRSDS
jgi:hypothetical protein